MSLLHLGAQKILTNKDEDNKPKKNKDGSFLVNFKIPYIVTPVAKKKKTKAKKFHHKPAKKPHHIKKFHHRIMHHKLYPPPHYPNAHAQDASRRPQPGYNQPPAPGKKISILSITASDKGVKCLVEPLTFRTICPRVDAVCGSRLALEKETKRKPR